MKKWHHFKFRFGYPARWWIDVYLIDTLFRDVLLSHRSNMDLWRFHRRSAPGDAGHQLSFLCFSTDLVAEEIQQIINNHTSITLLRENNIIQEELKSDYDSRIEATSDGHWPSAIQKSWPYYATGVCDMFIDLLTQLRTGEQSNDIIEDIFLVEQMYSKIHQDLSILWRDEGSHAFLHHINAIFGYEPILPKVRWSDGSQVIF